MSENRKNKLDEMFRDSFESLPEDMPSEMDWGMMRERLNEENLIKPSSGKGFSYMIPVVMLFFIGFSLYAYYQLKHRDEKLAEMQPHGVVNVTTDTTSSLENVAVDQSYSDASLKHQTESNQWESNSTEHIREPNNIRKLNESDAFMAQRESGHDVDGNVGDSRKNVGSKVFQLQTKKPNRVGALENNSKKGKPALPTSNVKPGKKNQVTTRANKKSTLDVEKLKLPDLALNDPSLNQKEIPTATSVNQAPNRSKLLVNHSVPKSDAVKSLDDLPATELTKEKNNVAILYHKASVENSGHVDEHTAASSDNKSQSIHQRHLGIDSSNYAYLDAVASGNESTLSQSLVGNHYTAVSDSLAKIQQQNTQQHLAKVDTNAVIKVDTMAKIKDSLATTSAAKQKDSSAVRKKRGWSIGPYLGINQGGFSLSSNNADGDTILSIGNDLGGKSKVNFSFGLQCAYELSKRLSLQIGVLYTQKSAVQSSFNKIGLSKDTNELQYNNYQFNFSGNYVETQFCAKYYVTKSKINTYILGGVVAQINIPGANNYFKIEHKSTLNSYSKTIDLSSKSLALATQIAVGFEYHLNEHWSVYAEPTYKFTFQQVVKHASFTQLPVSHYSRMFGLGIGAFYYF